MADEVLYFETRNCRVIKYRQGLSNEMYMILCGMENCIPGFTFGPAVREGYHLHCVISGKGKLVMGGQEFAVHGGQLFLTVPEKETWYQADREDPWSYCWITFDGCRVRNYLEYAGFAEGIYVLDCSIEVSRFLAIVQLILNRPNFHVSSDLCRIGYAYEFMSLAIESNEMTKHGPMQIYDFTPDDYVDYAVQYMEDNYSYVKIKEVADYLGISRAYFSMIFKKKMLMPPQEYLMQVKMNKGRELLVTTQLPVNSIAQRIGYENQLTFSKIFKLKYGLSPENYRKNYWMNGEPQR